MPGETSVFQNMTAIDAGAVMVAVVYLIEKIIGWVQKLRGTDGNNDSSEKINKLYDMHNVKDRDQVPVWYIRQSLLDNVDKMSNDLELIRHTLENMSNSDEEQLSIVKKIDLFHVTGGCSARLNKNRSNDGVKS